MRTIDVFFIVVAHFDRCRERLARPLTRLVRTKRKNFRELFLKNLAKQVLDFRKIVSGELVPLIGIQHLEHLAE